jgi:hypothetical protein
MPGGSEQVTKGDAGPAAIDRLWSDARELRAAIDLFIAARRDQIKLSLRRALIWTVAIGLAVFGAAILAAAACVMVVIGIAGGLGELLGGRIWLGQLLTGLGFLITAGLVGIFTVRTMQQRSRRKTLERYGKIER